MTRFRSPLLQIEIAPESTRSTEDLGVWLPTSHVELLLMSGGVTAFGGYFRLFGSAPGSPIGLKRWNDLEAWKFAWPPRVRRFYCFGCTALGDQYAYAQDDLVEGRDRVYFLEGLALQPEVIAESFLEFFDREFLRNARQPYDDAIRQARRRHGELRSSEMLVYSPSPLLGADERVENLMKLDAYASMILNGDLASQVAEESVDRKIVRVETYVDERGRTRLRVVWSDNERSSGPGS